MAFTFDLSTNTGKVRLLIPDRAAEAPLFQDDEIAAFLDLESANVRRAAALGLETIAADQAMTLKVIRLLDLSTDGAKTSDALLKRAEHLRAQADAVEAAEDGGAFDWAEWTPTVFAYRERIFNEELREG